MAYTATSWSALRLRLQDRLEQKIFWDNEEARLAVNEGLMLWNLLTGTWRTSTTFSTVANQYLYTLSASLLYRTRLAFGSVPLSSSSRTELDLGRPNWRSEVTTSGGSVPTTPVLFAPVSLRAVYLWPADAVGSNTVTVEGVAATPVLVEDGDTIDLGNEQIDVLLGFALHVLSFKKGGGAFATTTPLLQAFLAAAAEKNSRILTSTIYKQLMGLDRRDLKPLTGVPTPLGQLQQGAA